MKTNDEIAEQLEELQSPSGYILDREGLQDLIDELREKPEAKELPEKFQGMNGREIIEELREERGLN